MSALFLSVLNMSLTACYVILFVILVRLLLKKAPKGISFALWSVVAFRLMIPFSFESMYSLIPRNTNTIPIVHDVIYQQNPQFDSGIEIVDTFVSETLTVPTIGVSANPLQIYLEMGAYIWVLGIIALIVYSLISILILKRNLRSAKLIEQNSYEAENFKIPFVLGLIRPKIYLPIVLNVEERSYILLHEQIHIRRKDHIVKVLAFLILSVHWFNPLVWIAFMLMSTDMELSCDEKVLKEMNEYIKKPYANSLLTLATGMHILNGSPLAFGEGNVKVRIKNVLKYKRPRFWIIAVSIIIVTAVGIGLILNPKVSGLDEQEQTIELSTETVKKGISNHVLNPEVKLPAVNSNEKAGASIGVETMALQVLINFYNQTDDPIVIYEQISFDNNYSLVLADRITDGEHYPNLYLINSDGIVSALTRYSYGWTLNFTELSGYKVFFGLAGKEVSQASDNYKSVNKVEAIFEDKVETVKTRKNAYAYINLEEKDIETINNSNGYILVAKKTDMPEDIIGVFDDGQKISLSQASIDRNRSYMPTYLDSSVKSIYNSFAFTYSPMISPAYWMQIDSEEVGIKGSTDVNGNVNAAALRPSQAVYKSVHSTEIPNDVKAFYLSNGYPWTATFTAGENVEVIYSTVTELYDCHVYNLTSQSVDKEIGFEELKRLSVTGENRIILPKESGDYLFLLRTEKNFELRSYLGVIRIY
ncbi:MAG: antirepressor regulating drug resistance protein [Herbinix sp.]|jgi:beta-lactamase regulating signal transducer with metallopeptidase domain|nr:antirepressor regulating drug resistance protein [Herbinix sp.]